MPDGDSTRADAAAAATAADDAAKAGADKPVVDAPLRTNWFFYGLGLSLQTFLWFLLILALVVAIAVGGELTEFRYVGF